MKKILSSILFLCLLMQPLTAAVTWDLDSDSKVKLGGLLQLQNIWNKTASTKTSLVKRARIKVCYDYKQIFSYLVQTDLGLTAGGVQGIDARVIDAYAVLKLHKLAHIYNGMFLAPSSRQNLVVPNSLMTGVYSATSFKSLGWTGKVGNVFNSATATNTSAGFAGATLVRDTGITLFGSDSVNSDFHFKYYLGAFTGSKGFVDSGERLTGRVQVNFFDPEPGYYNLATYLGSKKTVGIGLSYDVQPNVASTNTTTQITDYKYMSVDAFADYPVGPGTLTAEATYSTLDLGDTAKTAEGKGVSVQLGYYMEDLNIQPWLTYEQWDAENTLGSCTILRLGASYFLNGQNTCIKIGVEQFTPNTGSKTNSAILGVYAAF